MKTRSRHDIRRSRGKVVTQLLFSGLIMTLSACSWFREEPGVHLIVEARLSEPLAASLQQFQDDLRTAGFVVSVDSSLDASATPAMIRAKLQERWAESDDLDGAILIGEFAAPLYNVPGNQGDYYWHDHLADLYYMDIDGYWIDADGNGVFDDHRPVSGTGVLSKAVSWLVKHVPLGLDSRGPEFWVSRLRAGTLAPLGDELTLYRDYFARNHAYRTGDRATLPKRAFILSGGSYFTSSGWGARPARLYNDVAVTECTPDASATLRKYLADPKGWSLGVVGSFSGPQVHKFDNLEGKGFNQRWFKTAEGRRLIAEWSLLEHKPHDVASPEVARLKPNVLFYQILSSETGRHDVPGYLGGAYLFFGSGLAAIAGTQHSGAMGVPVLYDRLEAGDSFGNAWRHALQWSLDHPGLTLTLKWCKGQDPWDPSVDPYKAVLLGDGTLHLPSESLSR
jgi:hypothetical protein